MKRLTFAILTIRDSTTVKGDVMKAVQQVVGKKTCWLFIKPEVLNRFFSGDVVCQVFEVCLAKAVIIHYSN